MIADVSQLYCSARLSSWASQVHRLHQWCCGTMWSLLILAPLQLSPMFAARTRHLASTSYRNGVHHAGCNSMPPRQSLSDSALELLSDIWNWKTRVLEIGLTVIHLTDVVRDLSVLLEGELTMKRHDNKTVSSVSIIFDGCGNSDAMWTGILWINWFTPFFSRLDYCNAVLYGLLHSTISPLQCLQNATWFIYTQSVWLCKNCIGC